MPTPRTTEEVGSVGAARAVCPAGSVSFASTTEHVSFPAVGRGRPAGAAGKAGAAKTVETASANEIKVENIAGMLLEMEDKKNGLGS